MTTELDEPCQIPLDELVSGALAKMATGEWRMLLQHPDPTEGSSVCGTEVTAEIARRIRSALADPPVPEGWQLVPVEPKPEMLGAFWRQKHVGTQTVGPSDGEVIDRSDYAAYRAMLSAAPVQGEG